MLQNIWLRHSPPKARLQKIKIASLIGLQDMTAGQPAVPAFVARGRGRPGGAAGGVAAAAQDVGFEVVTSVALGPHFTEFIDAQVQGGRYGTASDVVRAGLRLLEEHEIRVKALQEALNAGRQSGEPRPFDSEAFLSRMHAKHG